LLSILFGIGSALSWGAADFTGGLASKRVPSYQVLIVSELAGLLPIFALALIWNEPLASLPAWLWSAAAGGMGTIGLLLLYRALADGQMAIAAPVSAVLAAVVPVVVGSITEGLPDVLTFIGFGLALASIWTISQHGAASSVRLRFQDLRLPLFAGIFFGSFFVLMDRATQDAFFWPIVSGRIAGTLVVLIYAGAIRGSLWPKRAVWPISIFSGVVDVTGSVFYVLAAQAGRLDVAAVLAALYPASTVILARVFLKEQITRPQMIGVILAVGAMALMTV
jgi:drug/metabolite transporter (DMT)-like permease